MCSAPCRPHGQPVDEALLPYLSPLGWEHINLTGVPLTGDYFVAHETRNGQISAPTPPCQAFTCYFFVFSKEPFMPGLQNNGLTSSRRGKFGRRFV